MRFFLIIPLLCLSCLSFAQEEEIDLMLDWFINPNHAPIIIAEQNGYFRDQELNVHIHEPSDPSIPPTLVAAGKMDLAISYQPQLHLQVDQGLPVSRVATLIATPLNTLLVNADSDIQTIADLRDKQIGYSVAGVDEAMLTPILATGRLTLDDVTLVNVNWALAQSLMSKKVDAVIGGFRNVELNAMTLENHPGRAFFVEEHGIPAYDELILIANNQERDAAKLARFNQALERAVQFIVNHPNEAWQRYIDYKSGLNDPLNRMAWQDTLPRFALRPGALDANRYANYAEFMHAIGLIERVPPVSDYAIQP